MTAYNGHTSALVVEKEYKALLFPQVYPIAAAYSIPTHVHPTPTCIQQASCAAYIHCTPKLAMTGSPALAPPRLHVRGRSGETALSETRLDIYAAASCDTLMPWLQERIKSRRACA